jgi:hypothetical protein
MRKMCEYCPKDEEGKKKKEYEGKKNIPLI